MIKSMSFTQLNDNKWLIVPNSIWTQFSSSSAQPKNPYAKAEKGRDDVSVLRSGARPLDATAHSDRSITEAHHSGASSRSATRPRHSYTPLTKTHLRQQTSSLPSVAWSLDSQVRPSRTPLDALLLQPPCRPRADIIRVLIVVGVGGQFARHNAEYWYGVMFLIMRSSFFYQGMLLGDLPL